MTNGSSFSWSDQSGARVGRGGSIVGRDQHNTTNTFNGLPGDPARAVDPRSRSQAGTRILMLAANPAGTQRLALDIEAREITEKLQLAQARDEFDLITRWAVRPSDVLQHLNQHRPQIVHFSGHGNRSGEIVLSAGTRGEQRVSTAALAELFRTVRDETRIVVLNACYSTTQAQAISQHIDHVIGMRAPIDDGSAAVFAAAFYSALAFHRPVPQAFDQAKVALDLNSLPGGSVPELLTRPGANPFPISR
ncbi:CHAT domain-containing protein [Dactylosporangium sp. NPDC049742]|uniref:CHAT domain-containing protein n=1 Tax=Dactylosporangium sp. NPDC049742 TaxID=3154737 RepID=UPI0034435915